ncbi:MAG TPA: DUF2254 family protein, partial [Phycisphaerae bacterium]|nr:DUF2254 family protein [Phycisphaerae bacterium]
MSWIRKYRLRSYLESSIWIPPVIGIIVSQVAVRAILYLDREYAMDLHTDPGATRDLLVTLASSMFTLIVFVSSALLLAVQLASAQLTPRVISLLFKDTITKIALTLFVFTFTFALSVSVRIKSDIPLVAVRVAAYSSLVSLAFFIYLIDHVGKFLRPSGILRVVFAKGRRVIESVYPRPIREPSAAQANAAESIETEPARTIVSKRGGVVLAVDVSGLLALAQRNDCLIEMVPQVGEFVAAEEPLFRIHNESGRLSAEDLHNSVAVGSERTLEQDPAFAFRIMVDIASKGLSPAINDPTTA